MTTKDPHALARQLIQKECSALLRREDEAARIVTDAQQRLNNIRADKEALLASMALLADPPGEAEEGGDFGIGAPVTFLGKDGDRDGYVVGTSGSGWRQVEFNNGTLLGPLTCQTSDLVRRQGAGTVSVIGGKVVKSGATFTTKQKGTRVTLTRKVNMTPPTWEIETGDARTILTVVEDDLR